uniref:NADH dehydrogenase subunit 1 n=1 Tax=Spinactaletes boneti TaxID=2736147 RepID=UPI001EDE5BF8|nr:NADH dehydrogenase subunit 1 [Spinactaletes boneti]UJY98015.1 NADH dehydrogenase subunit 1 [Spinactaletes boneti]
MSYFISYLIMIVGVLISVAFMILFERKVMGYVQIRKGPNKVGFTGILQSFGDAIKLFIKEQMIPSFSNYIMFYFSPVLSLFLVVFLWSVLPFNSSVISYKFGGLFIFCCASMGIYALLGSGWSSNSNYALIGAMRGVAQTISYEVSMAILFISVIFIIGSYNVGLFTFWQSNVLFSIFLLPVFYCWIVSIFAETNRTPFDFAEGESELVSGFNIEYGSGGFALLFLSEYASIIFMSYLVSVIFLGGVGNLFLFNIKGCFLCFFFIWVRSTLPRYRYDKLMYLAWKNILPVSLNFMMFYFLIKVLLLI